MRAAMYYGVGDVRLEDVPEPVPGPDEVKLMVAFNGLCGTDLHEVFDSQRAIPATPHPLTGVAAPVILGHEIAGTVEAVGEGVDGFEDGELVAVEPLWRCGSCRWCRAGAFNLCDRLAFHGLSTAGGGLAQHTVVPAYMLHRTPAGMTPVEAALVESMAVSAHAVERSGVRPGQAAIVLGGGPIGIGVVAALQQRDVEVVAVVEPAPARRDVIEQLGVSTLDPAASSVLEQLNGRSVDVCFETSGAVPSIENALHVTAKQGTVLLVGSPRHPLPPILGAALARELEIRFTYGYNGEFPSVIAAIASGAYRLDAWVTTRPMSALHNALDELRAGQALKVLVDPWS